MAKKSSSGGGKHGGRAANRGGRGSGAGGTRKSTSSAASRKSTRSASTARPAASAKRAGSSTRAGAAAGKSTARRATGKVGADTKAALEVGGKLDFGIKADDAARRAARGENFNPRREESVRAARPGVDVPRDAGAGMPDSGPGSNSGGDVDVDFVGVGTGRGLAQSPPDGVTRGPAASDGSSDEFASGPKARGRNQLPRGTHGASKRVRGTTVNTGTPGTELGGSPDGGYAGDIAMGGTKTDAIDPLAGGPDSGADAERGQPGRGVRNGDDRTNTPTP